MTILSKPITVVGLLMLVGLFLLPMSLAAQDVSAIVTDAATPVLVIPAEQILSDANAPLVYGIVGVLAILLVGAMVYSSTITRYLGSVKE